MLSLGKRITAFNAEEKKSVSLQAAEVGIRLIPQGKAKRQFSKEQKQISTTLRAKLRHLHLRPLEEWMEHRMHQTLWN